MIYPKKRPEYDVSVFSFLNVDGWPNSSSSLEFAAESSTRRLGGSAIMRAVGRRGVAVGEVRSITTKNDMPLVLGNLWYCDRCTQGLKLRSSHIQKGTEENLFQSLIFVIHVAVHGALSRIAYIYIYTQYTHTHIYIYMINNASSGVNTSTVFEESFQISSGRTTNPVMANSLLQPLVGKLSKGKHRGTPKSSILIGVSIINQSYFGVPLFLETPI